MASIGSGGNYFSNINQQLAKGPDMKTAENLRHTGGTANTQRKSGTGKKGAVQEEGSTLSEAARKSLQTCQKEAIEGHEHELAQQAGLQEMDPESNESHELKMKRGYERDQDQKAEASGAGGQLPEGFVTVKSPQGIEQVLAPDQIEKLEAMDGDLDHIDRKVLGDIPPATLEAAERVLDNQLKDGLKPVAKLKPVPEAQDAGRMNLEAVDFMAQPLGIRESGNDRAQPMSLEFPDSMTAIAAEKAAAEFANGGHDEEMLIGGGSFSASGQTKGTPVPSSRAMGAADLAGIKLTPEKVDQLNIKFLNTAEEAKGYMKEQLGGKSVTLATSGYSAPPDGYEAPTRDFLEKLSGELKGDVSLLPSPTADKGSIDAITSEVAQKKGLPIGYVTADNYLEYVNPDNFSATMDKEAFAKVPKFSFPNGGEYSRATAVLSDSFLLTGGRNAAVGDFQNAITQGNKAVVLENSDNTKPAWDPVKGRVDNGSAYVSAFVRGDLEGIPMDHEFNQKFASFVDANRDRIQSQTLIVNAQDSQAAQQAAAFYKS